MKNIFAFMWQVTKGYRWLYFCMLIAPLIGAFYKPVIYYAIKLIIDAVTLTKNADFTFSLILWPIVMLVGSELVLSVIWRISEIAEFKSEPFVRRAILTQVVSKVLSFNYQFFQNNQSGAVTSKIKGVIDGYDTLWAQLHHGLNYWILASIVCIGSIFLINAQIGIIMLIYAIIYLSISIRMMLKLGRLSDQMTSSKHSVIGRIADRINNALIIKLFSSRIHEVNKLRKEIDNRVINKEIRMYKYNLKINIFGDIMAIIAIVLLILTMIHLKQTNQITVGDFAFIFGVVFQFFENAWHLMNDAHVFFIRIGDLNASLNVINSSKTEYLAASHEGYESNDQNKPEHNMQNNPQHIDQASLQNQSNNLNKHNTKIHFNHIYFSYSVEQKLFENFELAIQEKEKIGLVGVTGSGKTSLVSLLLQLNKPQHGNIILNGRDIRTMDNDELRSMITVIPQDITLFHRTLYENIAYGNVGATRDEVLHACMLAHVDEFATKLPDGYSTMVGERGIKLSGGQRQRIAIARAILKNAPIIVLDEATSALDSITEQYIQQSLENILCNKTVIVIAHRLSTLKNMDRLIVLQKGKIIEEGSHESLINNKNGVYQYMLQHQEFVGAAK